MTKIGIYLMSCKRAETLALHQVAHKGNILLPLSPEVGSSWKPMQTSFYEYIYYNQSNESIGSYLQESNS